jgi:very-short-patch-repair endonuclease
MLSGPESTKANARRLRKEMSLPEVLLWRAIRKRPDGAKFRRQHPAGAYVLDFYCDEVRLAIEVDGEVHGRGDRPARDEARDTWLGKKGVTVMRVSAVEVLRDLDGIVQGIVALVRALR